MRKYAVILLGLALLGVAILFTYSSPRSVADRSDTAVRADAPPASRQQSVTPEEQRGRGPGPAPVEIIAGDRAPSASKDDTAVPQSTAGDRSEAFGGLALHGSGRSDGKKGGAMRQDQDGASAPSVDRKPAQRAKAKPRTVRPEHTVESIEAGDEADSVRVASFDDEPPRPAPRVTRKDAESIAALARQARQRTPLPRPEAPDPLDLERMQGFENQAIEEAVLNLPGMTATADEPVSTFGVDVDTGSYALARARMREGYPPKPEHVRIEEFVNYFAYDYAQPVDGDFSVNFEAAPDPFEPQTRHLLRIGVQGRGVPDEARPPAHLTFVVDVSGSMFGPDGVGLVVEALDLLARNLRPDDTVALVTFAREARVAMWPAGAGQREVIAEVIARLEAGGSSALDAGLKLGYEVASTHFYAGHINRVVLLGDGRANVGAENPEEILAAVRAGVEDGVMLSTIGFGAKSFNDRMMEQLADRGNGNYFFVDSYREAQQVFRDRLCGTLFAIAQDVKIQVEFNPKTVTQYRLLGYENRKLTREQFRDDSVDAGEIGAGHQVTALYELVLAPDPDATVATVSVRYKDPGASRASEVNYQLFTSELHPGVRSASPDFKFAAAAALFAQVARRELPGSADRLSLIAEIAGEGITRPEDQVDRVEFVDLVKGAAPFFAAR